MPNSWLAAALMIGPRGRAWRDKAMERKAKGVSLWLCMGCERVQAVVLAMSATAGSEEVRAVCAPRASNYGGAGGKTVAWLRQPRRPRAVALGSTSVTMLALGDVAAMPGCKTVAVAVAKQSECRCPAGDKAKACLPP